MKVDSTRAPDGATTLITKFDPEVIDNAMADLEVTRAFVEASVHFVNEARGSVRESPGMQEARKNIALHDLCRADIMLSEIEHRLSSLKDRLVSALEQAMAAWNAGEAA